MFTSTYTHQCRINFHTPHSTYPQHPPTESEACPLSYPFVSTRPTSSTTPSLKHPGASISNCTLQYRMNNHPPHPPPKTSAPVRKDFLSPHTILDPHPACPTIYPLTHSAAFALYCNTRNRINKHPPHQLSLYRPVQKERDPSRPPPNGTISAALQTGNVTVQIITVVIYLARLLIDVLSPLSFITTATALQHNRPQCRIVLLILFFLNSLPYVLATKHTRRTTH